ncbi:MAG: M20/M25/M40 family metallo-hydrolase [Cryobacterium sp.]|nr:M20/M25/M40 family metallo-hydrolase [Cryobacterium sp.]
MTETAELLAALIAIDSVNPDLVPGGAGESAIADACTRWLAERGFEVDRLEERAGRPSIVAVHRGSGDGRTIMLNGHLDTVTLAGYDGDPLAPEVRDGRLYGRGGYDMKGGIAAMMVAAHRASQHAHSGDIMLALVADEEFASAGTEEVLRHYTADGAIVVEPSELEVTIAHRGFVWLEVAVEGVAAHGSRPDLGVDAIAMAGRFLNGLADHAEALLAGQAHPTLGTGSIHASTIVGGEELSSYPARCVIGIERRTVPGETGESVESELTAILEAVAAADPRFRYRVTRGLEREPFDAPRESAVVQSLLRQVERVTDAPPVLRGEPFWTDCALLADAGIPAVLFGVAGGGAHAAVEWVDLASLEVVTDVLEGTIVEFCA